MIEISGTEYFSELLSLLNTNEMTLPARYRRVRFLFERLCKQVTLSEATQFPNLFSRLSWINRHLLGEDPVLTRELNTLRVRISQIINEKIEPDSAFLREDLYILAKAVTALLGEPIPSALLLERTPLYKQASRGTFHADAIPRMRARFIRREDDRIIVQPEDKPDGGEIRVCITSEYDGRCLFHDTLEQLHEGAQINLLQVIYDTANDLFRADLIVLEPDFLLDISAIAECFRDYGHHPLNYLMSRLSPDQNTHHILLGNIANQFLDDIINATEESPADYMLSMSKVFRQSPVSIAACEALEDPEVQKSFFDETKTQFHNIREVVEKQFSANGIDRDKALLEPSFVCEALGLQGRLDLLQQDYTRFIELKSGKAKQLYPSPELTYKENHYVQMMLYYAVLHYNAGVKPEEIDAYLLYSKYPLLYRMGVYWGLVKQAVDLRNQIVALEYRIQQHNDPLYSREILHTINADTLNVVGMNSSYWNRYLKPSIDRFAYEHSSLSPIESDYFHSLFTFITKEQYTAKAGDTDTEFKRGVTMLWNASLDEKEEAGEIIHGMRILQSEIKTDKHLIRLSVPQGDDLKLPNYRTGDSVLLYKRCGEDDRVTTQQVFKASIEEIDSVSLLLSLRAIQKNESVLPHDATYAIERDYMDVAFSSMLKGLSQFMYASASRRSLLLAQRIPRQDLTRIDSRASDANDVERIVRKVVAAEDYFLLVGPPGTGKTSYALRRMVETFYADPQKNILLLAYTNKAVDEICRSLASISSDFPYIRIGQESACEEDFKPRLMKNVMKESKNRLGVRNTLAQYRVFVGTLSSFSRQTELFRLKSFDVAIVDEATQILEPQILGLLCATAPDGKDAIRKFVLIGDYKQLPAVVVQSDENATVRPESLKEIGITSHKESLFERLYRWEQKQGRTQFCDMLTLQGRMHPAISDFPNRYFYQGRLGEIPLDHQKEIWDESLILQTDFEAMVQGKRFAFFPTTKTGPLSSNKVNPMEAAIVARIIECWLRSQSSDCDPVRSIGVITPYRSQIAMIRKELQERRIPDADKIVIDTVERFQGAQRDLMIYSCCMNEAYQMNFLSNTIVEEDQIIDRKLNVALTRARKQMFITGNPVVLSRDPIYRRLLDYIRSKNGYYSGDYDSVFNAE